MGEIKDLNLLLGEPIRAKLGETIYSFPADCPAELYLQLIRYSQLDIEESDATEELSLTSELRDGILDLFRVHQPDLDRLPAAVSLDVLVRIIGELYGPGEDPTPAPAGGQAGTKRRKPKAKAAPTKASTAS